MHYALVAQVQLVSEHFATELTPTNANATPMNVSATRMQYQCTYYITQRTPTASADDRQRDGQLETAKLAHKAPHLPAS